MTSLILFLVGVFVGGVNAIAGAGMLVGFPVLTMFGVSDLVANATGKFIVLPGQITAVAGYREFLRTMSRKHLILLVPILLGSILGAGLLRTTSSGTFAVMAPYLVLAAVVVFAVEPLIRKEIAHDGERRVILPTPVLAAILFLMSIYAGYFGVGYGLMLLAVLSFAGMKSIHHMNAFKNLAGVLMLIVTILILMPGAYIDWASGVAMALGTAVGGYGVARIAPRISVTAIRIVIIVFGLAATAYFFAGNTF